MAEDLLAHRVQPCASGLDCLASGRLHSGGTGEGTLSGGHSASQGRAYGGFKLGPALADSIVDVALHPSAIHFQKVIQETMGVLLNWCAKADPAQYDIGDKPKRRRGSGNMFDSMEAETRFCAQALFRVDLVRKIADAGHAAFGKRVQKVVGQPNESPRRRPEFVLSEFRLAFEPGH